MAYDTSNPYGIGTAPTWYEQKAGVPTQQYQSLLDSNGNLKSAYSVDPTQSSAFNQMAQIAQSSDLSPWAKLQMQSNDLNTLNARDQSAATAQGQTNSALQNLMATGGGTSSGMAALLGMQGARNATMASQNIGNQAELNALGIQSTDATNKQQLLGQVANTETAAQGANAASAVNDTANANTFNANRYNQQMQAYGAQQTANAQVQAANKSKKK